MSDGGGALLLAVLGGIRIIYGVVTIITRGYDVPVLGYGSIVFGVVAIIAFIALRRRNHH